jgi:hypothetical protein
MKFNYSIYSKLITRVTPLLTQKNTNIFAICAKLVSVKEPFIVTNAIDASNILIIIADG